MVSVLAGFQLQDEELGVAGDAGGKVRRQSDRLVEGVGEQALGLAADGGQRLDGGARNVGEDILRGQ